MTRNDYRAFGMGDLVPESQIKTASAFEKARAEYELKQIREATERAQREEEYNKIKTYSVIGGSVLAVVALVLFLRSKS